MRVQVSLFGTYRSHPAAPRGRAGLDLPEGQTVLDVFQILGIDVEPGSLIAVNGEAVDLRHALHDGDRIQLFSPMGGGATPPFSETA